MPGREEEKEGEKAAAAGEGRDEDPVEGPAEEGEAGGG